MSTQDDIQFLAKLVHNGNLKQEDAKSLLPSLQSGEGLDALLVQVLDWDSREVERLRRTNAGEIPEVPGYQIVGNLGTGGTAARRCAAQPPRPTGTGYWRPWW